MIIGRLAQGLCPMYARQHKANAETLPLDRLHNGREEGDEARIKQNF